ncbi:MAG: PBP1A family penicillin-binding protein [Vicinamibacteria bacterium]|nr:PBP1A family penicillin-binding protein [Vicinamibacteria bacterium]
MSEPNTSNPAHGGRTYSVKRLRLMALLLTLITLPVVVGTSYLIFLYMRYSVVIERRLKGERWMIPSRIYARPLALQNGLILNPPDFVKHLNDLRYEQRSDGPSAPGEFVLGTGVVIFYPRPGPDAGSEPIIVSFEKDKAAGRERIRDLRGQRSKRAYARQTLEPQLITYLFDENREKRRLVRYEDLPDHLIKAVLAIEDRRFFSHPGIDPFGILASIIRNIRAESYVRGGSTITQQLVKNYFLREEAADGSGRRMAPRTFKRKVQEAFLAFILERRATKKEIIELYLNEIYLGQVGSFSINGVGEAARMYFHKDVGNLSLPESAMLAGMIQSPNPYNPYRHVKQATERRNTVLKAMAESSFIEEAAAQAAMAQPLRVETQQSDKADAPYFVDLVKDQLASRYASRDLVTQNLSIYTSLDLRLQAIGQEAVVNGLVKVDAMFKQKPKAPVQACLIALDPATGAILAMVGGRSYGYSQYNRVTEARRQPGSTFKPFVYLAAFEATFEDAALPPLTPATIVEDDNTTVFLYEDKEYIPENYEGKYLGPVTLRKALALSLNVATVKVAEIVGFDRIANLWSKKLGIGSNIKAYPAVALGSFEATPLEMATAYNVLANGGLKVDPYTVLKVTDEQGQVIEQYKPRPPKRVVHEESAFLVTHMLRSVLNEGTGAAARAWGFHPDAAGKTGTTNDMRDAWFAGYTPDLLCIVWVGFDDNTPINMSGARAALPIWVDFMKTALTGVRTRPFAVPAENIVFYEIDKGNGMLARPGCPKVFNEAFIAGTEPKEYCNEH